MAANGKHKHAMYHFVESRLINTSKRRLAESLISVIRLHRNRQASYPSARGTGSTN
jgi:hypothetical protein